MSDTGVNHVVALDSNIPRMNWGSAPVSQVQKYSTHLRFQRVLNHNTSERLAVYYSRRPLPIFQARTCAVSSECDLSLSTEVGRLHRLGKQ